jgi:hypothetical protein
MIPLLCLEKIVSVRPEMVDFGPGKERERWPGSLDAVYE